METKVVDKQVRAGPATKDSLDSLPTNKDNNTTSLSLPPVSVKATESDSGHNAKGLLSGEAPGSGLPDNERFISTAGGADTGIAEKSVLKGGELNGKVADAVNDEPSIGYLSDDLGQKANSQEKDRSSRKEGNISMEDINDEQDSLISIINQITRDTLWPSVGELRHPLQERVKKGAKLAVQQMEYTRLMEDRMKDMEKRLQLIENKGKEPEPPAHRPRMTLDLIMDIKRMAFYEYLPTETDSEIKRPPNANMQHKPRHEFPGQLPYHVIDVVNSVSQQERLGIDQVAKAAAGPLDPAGPAPSIPHQDLKIDDVPSVQPERIRINSAQLLRSLEKITGAFFSTTRVDTDRVLQDQVILRPFKLFVTFEQEIRYEIDRLEKLHMQDRNESKLEAPETAKSEDQEMPTPADTDVNVALDIPGNPTPEHSDDLAGDKSQNAATDASVDEKYEEIYPLKSRRYLEELLVLRDLLDKDLKPTFDLRRHIKDGSARSISFQDLWHLFPLGSEIISNDTSGQSQVSRILNVSGGRPFLCTRYEADMDPRDPSSTEKELPKFEILSYYYNFDGKELGACQQLYSIKSYDGNKAIASLPCFPVIYSKHSHKGKPRDFFIERGKRYVELTRKTEVVHKRYNGLTLVMDKLREEVRTILRTMCS